MHASVYRTVLNLTDKCMGEGCRTTKTKSITAANHQTKIMIVNQREFKSEERENPRVVIC